MPKNVPGRKVLSVLLTDEEYEQVKILSSKMNTSMASIGRDFIIKGLSGEVTQNNMEFIVPIIREQVRNVIEPMMERQIALTAKTCVQAGTATYLCADAILKFVPKEQREEVRDSYEKARKQAVAYVKAKPAEQEE